MLRYYSCYKNLYYTKFVEINIQKIEGTNKYIFHFEIQSRASFSFSFEHALKRGWSVQRTHI